MGDLREQTGDVRERQPYRDPDEPPDPPPTPPDPLARAHRLARMAMIWGVLSLLLAIFNTVLAGLRIWMHCR